MSDESTDATQDLLLETENGVTVAITIVEELLAGLKNTAGIQTILHEDLAARAKAQGMEVRATKENEDGTVTPQIGGAGK